MRSILLLAAVPAAVLAQSGRSDSLRPPAVMRELRAVWVATVTNMDWPSKPGLSTAEQQRELIAILDRAAELRMNAVIFQVRPEGDALYESPYEPWSRYLTGRQGRAPSPRWDPLKFAIDEAHKRGLELHAWFNPYRAAFWKDSATASTHVTKTRPGLVLRYAQYLWMDPSSAEVRRRFLRVVLDVVRRYDVDGVHIDDYFYPAPETDASGRTIPFPDDRSYAAYQRGGGKLSRGDWRRRNVNQMVSELYAAVKGEKMWVKVGISPFGIWRPGVPATTTAGLDQYNELYADVRKWLREGTLDYLAPQLYWPPHPAAQNYEVLVRWWVSENVKRRHVWPGLALYKLPITGPRKMSPSDILEEIRITRMIPDATGHVLFNAKVLMDNVEGIADSLAAAYSEPALIPSATWLDRIPPARPAARLERDSNGTITVHFAPKDQQRVARWVVQWRAGAQWKTEILPGARRSLIFKDTDAVAAVRVSAVDRNGNVSAFSPAPLSP